MESDRWHQLTPLQRLTKIALLSIGVNFFLVLIYSVLLWTLWLPLVAPYATVGFVISTLIALGLFAVFISELRYDWRAAFPPRPIPPIWFEAFFLCVPKSVREPWFGDLCEQRLSLFNSGRSRLLLEATTIGQLLVMLLFALTSLLGTIAGRNRKNAS